MPLLVKLYATIMGLLFIIGATLIFIGSFSNKNKILDTGLMLFASASVLAMLGLATLLLNVIWTGGSC